MVSINKITISAEDPESPNSSFRAIWRDRESVGKTAGAALDALTGQMKPSDSAALVFIQNLRPDAFFTEVQQLRLQELLTRQNAMKASGAAMSADEQRELEDLVFAELDGSAGRAAAMADEMGL